MKTAIRLSFLILLITNSAIATEVPSCFCKNGNVFTGATKSDVIAKCGKPTHIQSRRIPDAWNRVVYAESWFYNFGRNKFVHYFNFEGDTVKSIESGGYGK